jgi:hypothetical protein
MEAVAKPAMAEIAMAKIGPGEAVAVDSAKASRRARRCCACETIPEAAAAAKTSRAHSTAAKATGVATETTAAKTTGVPTTHAAATEATVAAASTTATMSSASASATGQGQVRRQHAD